MSRLGKQVRHWLGLNPESSARRQQLSLAETENTLTLGAWQAGENPRDRRSYDRQDVLADCMDAWRFNPLARRITELTTNYVTGGGFVVSGTLLNNTTLYYGPGKYRTYQAGTRVSFSPDGWVQ